jgi:hypothetical protein
VIVVTEQTKRGEVDIDESRKPLSGFDNDRAAAREEVVNIVASLPSPPHPMAEGAGGERLGMPEVIIRKGDNHASLPGGQSIEGEKELVFPKFVQPRR